MFRLIDALIQPEARSTSSPDELNRLRMLAGVSFVLFLVCLADGLLIAPGRSTLALEICLLGVLIPQAWVVVRLRVWGETRGSAEVLIGTLLAAIIFASAHAEALYVIVSPSSALVIVLALYLMGTRRALVATALVGVSILTLAWLHHSGLTLGPLLAAGDRRLTDSGTAVVVLFGILGVIAVLQGARMRAYETLNEALHTLKEAESARDRAQVELALAQKLEAVGRLAAGVAHEINTPIQYVSDSVQFIHDAWADLATAVPQLQAVRKAVIEDKPAGALAHAALDAENAADLDYVLANVPAAIERSMEGLRRVTDIVRGMKDFSHPGGNTMRLTDLNRAVEGTLNIARSEYKLVADVETDFGALPLVMCHTNELNQVVLNLVINAAHAIGDVVKGTAARGRIKVTTHRDGDKAVISIADTGSGISDEVRDKIFTPFFTTKEVGRGTGQGLAIARRVVMKHGGSLSFDSAPGNGTTFHVRLPLTQQSPTP